MTLADVRQYAENILSGVSQLQEAYGENATLREMNEKDDSDLEAIGFSI